MADNSSDNGKNSEEQEQLQRPTTIKISRDNLTTGRKTRGDEPEQERKSEADDPEGKERKEQMRTASLNTTMRVELPPAEQLSNNTQRMSTASKNVTMRVELPDEELEDFDEPPTRVANYMRVNLDEDDDSKQGAAASGPKMAADMVDLDHHTVRIEMSELTDELDMSSVAADDQVEADGTSLKSQTGRLDQTQNALAVSDEPQTRPRSVKVKERDSEEKPPIGTPGAKKKDTSKIEINLAVPPGTPEVPPKTDSMKFQVDDAPYSPLDIPGLTEVPERPRTVRIKRPGEMSTPETDAVPQGKTVNKPHSETSRIDLADAVQSPAGGPPRTVRIKRSDNNENVTVAEGKPSTKKKDTSRIDLSQAVSDSEPVPSGPPRTVRLKKPGGGAAPVATETPKGTVRVKRPGDSAIGQAPQIQDEQKGPGGTVRLKKPTEHGAAASPKGTVRLRRPSSGSEESVKPTIQDSQAAEMPLPQSQAATTPPPATGAKRTLRITRPGGPTESGTSASPSSPKLGIKAPMRESTMDDTFADEEEYPIAPEIKAPGGIWAFVAMITVVLNVLVLYIILAQTPIAKEEWDWPGKIIREPQPLDSPWSFM